MSNDEVRPFSIANLRAGGSIYLFAALLSLFVTIPALDMIEPFELLFGSSSDGLRRLFVRIVTGGTLITAAVTIAHSEHPVRLIVLLVAVPLAIELPVSLGWDVPTGLRVLGEVWNGGALLFVVCLGVRAMFRSRGVTADMITLTLCAYLLVGLAWMYLYEAVWRLGPEAAFEGLRDLRATDGRTDDFFYFSFVTLTTLGYGEITPESSVARSLAIVEAITGQLFVAVVIARIVGLEIASAASRTPDTRPADGEDPLDDGDDRDRA